MKYLTYFQCERCQDKYPSEMQAAACEAGHYGLDVTEYYRWKKLCKDAAAAGKRVGARKYPETEQAFTQACAALDAFEKEHGLSGKGPKPSDFYF